MRLPTISPSGIIKTVVAIFIAGGMFAVFEAKLSAHIDATLTHISKTKTSMKVLRQICRNTAKTEAAIATCNADEDD